MKHTHYCPTCDADFPVQDIWAPGECPTCHDKYYVTELYAEDFSDHWPDVQWESQERQLREIMSEGYGSRYDADLERKLAAGPTGPVGVPAMEFLAAGPTGPAGIPLDSPGERLGCCATGPRGPCGGCPTGEPGPIGPPGISNMPYHEMIPTPPPKSFWPTPEHELYLVGGKEAALALTIEIERRILETMQSAFEADPAAMRALTVNRVPCNGLLADHPSIPVQDVPVRWNVPSSARHELGMIGMIVGIMRDLGCENVISWEFEDASVPTDDQQLFFKGFKLVPRT